MGLFSFLFDQQTPTGGGFMSEDTLPKADPNAPIDPGMSVPRVTGSNGDLGEARTLPHMETQPGLLSRLKTPDANGMTFSDKLALSGMMMRDNADPSTVMEYQRSRLAQQQFQRQLALQQRGNQAFRAAYQTDPKTGQTRFNPQVYAQVMGDALDPKDMVAMAKTFAPEESLQDGFITRKDPLTGELTITAQRPMSYGEQNSASTLAETQRHNGVEEGQGASRIAEDARSHRVNESIAGGNLSVAQQNAGTTAAHLSLDRIQAARAANPGAPVLATPQDYARFPGGTYIAPDGSIRSKPRAQ